MKPLLLLTPIYMHVWGDNYLEVFLLLDKYVFYLDFLCISRIFQIKKIFQVANIPIYMYTLAIVLKNGLNAFDDPHVVIKA